MNLFSRSLLGLAVLVSAPLLGCGGSGENGSRAEPVARPAAEPAQPAPASAHALPSIAQQTLLERLGADGAPLVLDVRSPSEYAGGHIPGARNVPHTDLPRRLGELEAFREREVVVTCEQGGRSRVAIEALRDAGFSNVLHLEGDMQAWRRAGRPLEKPDRG